jgi:DNA repair protein RadC
MEYTPKTNIKSWAEEDRPREKLLRKGRSSLSEAELIAILIGSGTPDLSAVELSKTILAAYENSLNKLAKLSVVEFTRFKGIGEAKAVSIIAALELGRRRSDSVSLKKFKIQSSLDAYNFMKPHLHDLDHEQFWIILLKRNLEVILPIQISVGGTSSTIVDTKIIFKHAIDHLASHIVLLHNHPSGSLEPSNSDVNITKKIKEASELFEIRIVDHIIYTNSGYYSLADQDKL